ARWMLFLAHRCVFESLLFGIRLSLFCGSGAVPLDIPGRVRSTRLDGGSSALIGAGEQSGQRRHGAAAKSTLRRRVESSEGVIPVVILNWNGEHDTVEC